MRTLLFIAGIFITLGPINVLAAQWPDLLKTAPAVGGGSKDAAVIMAVENYAFVSPVPGARANATAWYDYLNKTRGIPYGKIFLNVDNDVTAEDIKLSASKAAAAVGEGGTLWYVFIGHGAPSADGKQGLLVGVDAQQKVESISARSLPQNDLVTTLLDSKAGSIVLFVDACFSGRSVDGAPLIKGLQPLAIVPSVMLQDSRLVSFAAAGGKEFAGQLPGAERPAFSYLALGGLRGWADADQNGIVTAEELRNYTDGVMRTMVKDRTQTPQLQGDGAQVLVKSPGEKGPDLAELAKGLAGQKSSPFEFKISALAKVPTANAPTTGGLSVPQAQMPEELSKQVGIDFSGVDVNSLEKYNTVILFEKSAAAPLAKRLKWEMLGKDVPAYAELASKRSSEWFKYAEDSAIAEAVELDGSSVSPEEKAEKWSAIAKTFPNRQIEATERQKEWTRYAAELAAIAKAKKARRPIMKKDYVQLERLLALSVVTEIDKQNFAVAFADSYGKNYDDNPFIGELERYLPNGYLTYAEKAEINKRETIKRQEQTMSNMAFIPAGTFLAGAAIDRNSPTTGVHGFIYKEIQAAGTDILTLGGTNSSANAVSSDGNVTVGDSDKTGNTASHAFKYSGGTMTDLGTLGGTNSTASGVSSDGSVIVGGSDNTGNATTHAFKYSGGIMTDLGTLGGGNSGANHVSADGTVIAGYSYITGNAAYHAFKYSAGSMTDLGTLGGLNSSAFGISGDGSTIVGWSKITGNTAEHAFKYSGGSMSDLGTLGGTNAGATAASYDGAVIVGYSDISGNAASHAFKYAGGSMTDLGTLGGSDSYAAAVSGDGAVIVGNSKKSGDIDTHAFRFANGIMTDLGTLGGRNSYANGVSADGTVIVGQSWLPGNTSNHAFIYRTRMVDVDNTKDAIVINGYQLNSLINLKTFLLADSLTSDCAQFGQSNYCLALTGRHGDADKADQTALGFKLAYKINPKVRVGLWFDQALTADNGNFHIEAAGPGENGSVFSPLIGAFIVVNSAEDNTGGQFKMSVGYNESYLKITRSVLSNTEAGQGNTALFNIGYMAEYGYGIRLHNTWAARPFTGLRRTEVLREGYTEKSGADFPVTYKDVYQNLTTAIFGLRTGGKLSKSIGLSLGGGIERDIYSNNNGYKGTINMMSAFNLSNPKNDRTRYFAETNLNCILKDNQNLNIGVSLARPMLDKAGGLIARVIYTIGL